VAIRDDRVDAATLKKTMFRAQLSPLGARG